MIDPTLLPGSYDLKAVMDVLLLLLLLHKNPKHWSRQKDKCRNRLIKFDRFFLMSLLLLRIMIDMYFFLEVQQRSVSLYTNTCWFYMGIFIDESLVDDQLYQ